MKLKKEVMDSCVSVRSKVVISGRIKWKGSWMNKVIGIIMLEMQ